MKSLPIAVAGILAIALPRPAGAQAETRSGFFKTSDAVELHYLEAGAGSSSS